MASRLSAFMGFATAIAAVCPSSAAADEVALSFVHREERIDVSSSAIRSIEAVTVKIGASEYHQVEICFSRVIQRRVCQLTRRIIEQPLEVVVGCKVVAKPIIREALCKHSCLAITATDEPEADDLAGKLRDRPQSGCRPPVS